MALRFACDRPDQVKAIGVVIAALPKSRAAVCRSGKPVPALFMAGTVDPVMTFDGHPSAIGARSGRSVPMLSIPKTVALWRQRNGCGDAAVTTDVPDLDPSDQSTVTKIDYRDCPANASVVFYRINGGGHQIPSLDKDEGSRFVARILGPRNHDIDGSEQVWRFFTR